MLFYKASVIVVITLLITACSPFWQQRPAGSPETLWQARQIKLSQLDQWQIQGRTVITQGQEAFNAGLRWQQNQAEYHIQLLGPFAQGGVSLDGDPHRVVLTMADGQQVASSSAEALIAETLSWRLPVSALRDWVRGLPYSQQSYQTIELNTQGQITYLLQQDWQVEFLRYVPFGELSMPSKIFITHPDLSLRLVISRWENI